LCDGARVWCSNNVHAVSISSLLTRVLSRDSDSLHRSMSQSHYTVPPSCFLRLTAHAHQGRTATTTANDPRKLIKITRLTPTLSFNAPAPVLVLFSPRQTAFMVSKCQFSQSAVGFFVHRGFVTKPGSHHPLTCARVCVCVCVRMCVRACVCVCLLLQCCYNVVTPLLPRLSGLTGMPSHSSPKCLCVFQCVCVYMCVCAPISKLAVVLDGLCSS
jgi:hypothetical protein